MYLCIQHCSVTCARVPVFDPKYMYRKDSTFNVEDIDIGGQMRCCSRLPAFRRESVVRRAGANAHDYVLIVQPSGDARWTLGNTL